MPEIALDSEGGTDRFHVSWSEPMQQTVETRQEAERLVAWLRTNRLTVDVDGSCGPCRAHHLAGHDCPACGADLSLRVGVALRRLVATLPRSAWDGFAVARLQHLTRVRVARQRRESWLAECRRGDTEVAIAERRPA